MTEMCLLEIAAAAATAVISGASIEFGGVAKATKVDHFTPMEPRLASEVAHGAVGLTRSQGNVIIKALLEKYETEIPRAPVGTKYGECWDIQSKRPSQEYQELYLRIKEEIARLGIRFKF